MNWYARAVLALLLASSLLANPVPTRAAQNAELTRLEEAVGAHPDDPDLLWSLAMALARHRRASEAADRLEVFEARWPGRRSDTPFQRGRLLYEAGRSGEALEQLERAIEHEPNSGATRLFLALTLRALGRNEEADREFAVVTRTEPPLKAEALLFRAIHHLETRDTDEARTFLHSAIAADRSGEIAELARLAPLASPPQRDRRVNLFASAGIETDSNVMLESNSDLPGSIVDESDTRYVWGAGVSLRPLQGESGGLVIGYRLDQSDHRDLESYDLVSHIGFVSATLRAREHIAFRLDGFYAASVRDGDRYSRAASAQPSLLVTLGRHAGVLRLYGEATRRSYFEEPLFSSLERGGTTLGLGAAHFVELPWRAGMWASWGGYFAGVRTDAERDLLGFKGDYDHVRIEGSMRLQIPLAWKLALKVSAVAARERYLNRNLIDALTDNGIGTSDPDRRRDTIAEGRLALVLPLTRYLELEIAWRGIRRLSNVDAYDYERRVFGLYLRTRI